MDRWQFRHSIRKFDFGAYIQNNSIKHGFMFRDSIYDISATAQGKWVGSVFSQPSPITPMLYLLLDD